MKTFSLAVVGLMLAGVQKFASAHTTKQFEVDRPKIKGNI